MCLLIFKPENVSIPHDYVINGDINNPHGCGIAWADGKKIRISKGAKWRADEISAALDKIGNAPAIIHFRFATHGSQVDKNTHPFPLPGQWAGAHNGVISGLPTKQDESDTRAFLRLNVAPFIAAGGSMEQAEKLAEISALMGTGNKMAFLHGSGKFALANEKSGHWNGGAWFSNYGYELEDWTSYHITGGAAGRNYKKNYFAYSKENLECCSCGKGIIEMKRYDELFICKQTGNIFCDDCMSLAEYDPAPTVSDKNSVYPF